MKKMVLCWILIPFFLFSLFSIDDDYKNKLEKLIKKSIAPISPETLFDLIQKGAHIYILDTREPEEFQVSHIKGALNTGYKKFDSKIIEHIPLTATIIVYCSVGYRSEKIGEKIVKMGYKNVYNLYGGIFEWINLSYPVYDQEGVITANIHGYSKKWARWLKRGRVTY